MSAHINLEKMAASYIFVLAGILYVLLCCAKHRFIYLDDVSIKNLLGLFHNLRKRTINWKTDVID